MIITLLGVVYQQTSGFLILTCFKVTSVSETETANNFFFFLMQCRFNVVWLRYAFKRSYTICCVWLVCIQVRKLTLFQGFHLNANHLCITIFLVTLYVCLIEEKGIEATGIWRNRTHQPDMVDACGQLNDDLLVAYLRRRPDVVMATRHSTT